MMYTFSEPVRSLERGGVNPVALPCARCSQTSNETKGLVRPALERKGIDIAVSTFFVVVTHSKIGAKIYETEVRFSCHVCVRVSGENGSEHQR